MSLNPGYKVVARRNRSDLADCDPGPALICPICRRVVVEATADRLRIKCQHCRHWVYAEKMLDSHA